ncbi:peptide chain release factor N(5)-glutamine methyltransferase [Hoylesella enoeca]|nr:peptide chain release factor N(5)-glutamine methyltransferase [Hoylesella enoeca]
MLEMGFGITMTDVVCGKLDEMNEEERVKLKQMMLRLERNEPVQYVLGQAYFDGDIYEVTPDVLIPRPETEALCRWIVEEWHGEGRLLDCCTGSGCIAITLKKRCPQLSVDAYDLSSAALKVARRNAERLQQDIRLFQMDALNPIPATEKYDIIVANPPYICEREKRDMRPNVLQFEPHKALFVPDNDPLRFYTAITCYAADALKPGGRLYFEINPLFVDALKTMIRSFGFREIEVDRHFGYDQRMMKAQL